MAICSYRGAAPSAFRFATVRRVDIVLILLSRIRDERKISIVMTEHVMAAVMSLCEHVTVLDAGKLIASGTPQEVVQNAEVIAAYLGKKHA